jgi:hypothetical protein
MPGYARQMVLHTLVITMNLACLSQFKSYKVSVYFTTTLVTLAPGASSAGGIT